MNPAQAQLGPIWHDVVLAEYDRVQIHRFSETYNKATCKRSKLIMQNQKKRNMKYKLPVQEPSRAQRGAENEKALQRLLAQPLPARDHVPHRTCQLSEAKSSAKDN